jgi:hypothetical protein
MTIPISIGPLRTYYDPTLWTRLEPVIREHLVDETQHLVDGKWKTIEEARQRIGYLRALEWVFHAADDLTRVEQQDRPE